MTTDCKCKSNQEIKTFSQFINFIGNNGTFYNTLKSYSESSSNSSLLSNLSLPISSGSSDSVGSGSTASDSPFLLSSSFSSSASKNLPQFDKRSFFSASVSKDLAERKRRKKSQWIDLRLVSQTLTYTLFVHPKVQPTAAVDRKSDRSSSVRPHRLLLGLPLRFAQHHQDVAGKSKLELQKNRNEKNKLTS
jgi:hypothetical protein